MIKYRKKFGWKAVMLAMIFSVMIPVQASSTKDKIDDVKEQQEQSQQRKKEIESKIQELEVYKADAISYIQKMDAELADVEARLEDLGNQQTIKEQEIAETEIELEDAKKTEREQYESMKLRIQYMYENGNESYLEMLLGAESFADLLNKSEYIAQITSYDRDMLDAYQQTILEVEAKEAQLEEENRELTRLIQESEDEKGNLQRLIDAKAVVLAGYEADIENGESEVSALEADMAKMEAELSELEAQLKREEEEAARQAAAARRTYDGGSLGFPMAWYYRKTSDFGYRNHPIFGQVLQHNGVDLSADTGTAIYAAYNGTVVVSTYNSSAGNYIMIDHGSGLMTVYMHCSKLLVSVGETVSKGQTIGLVGSTGNSTGPHLHFSVRLNGSYVDPKPYIGLN
ncbi:MAG: peptidoglycan DD-metalloendopeptidase family protein [Lachnospiraceae bacterium]|nr:peptidoglycan DD-metalloendopeptidase family protein [Lachnospiraceae bacterium]